MILLLVDRKLKPEYWALDCVDNPFRLVGCFNDEALRARSSRMVIPKTDFTKTSYRLEFVFDEMC